MIYEQVQPGTSTFATSHPFLVRERGPLVPHPDSRRVISKAGSDPTRLLERVDSHISKQPKVSGESAQV